MSQFLTTRGISSQLEEILIGAESFLYILTPYLKFSHTLYERLSETTKKGIEVCIVCKEKQNLSPHDERLLLDLQCNVYFKKDLHAKCYANEHSALIASMNLYNYSEANNREMGVLLTKKEDEAAYLKCVKEIKSIITNSEPFRVLQTIPVQAENKAEITFEEFQASWRDYLVKKYPTVTFEQNGRTISAANFPLIDIDFSTDYGFATFNFHNSEKMKVLRNSKKNEFERSFDSYRCYWSSPGRICLYHAKEFDVDNLTKNIEYCGAGLEKLICAVSDLLK